MTLTLSSNIILDNVPEEIVNQCVRDNTFKNPIFISNERNGLSNWNTDRTIKAYRYELGRLVLPRGYMRNVLEDFRENKITPQIIDERISYTCEYPDKLIGVELRSYQQRAVNEAMHFDQGCIISPTGSGKSLIGIEIIRQRKQKALIILHRKDLADQWYTVIKERLGLDAGFIGNGQWNIGAHISVAMIQTLANQENRTRELCKSIGLVLVEEGHHIPSHTCLEVLNYIPAKYRYTISATPQRRDGLEEIIYRAVGPSIAVVTREEVEKIGATVPVSVKAIDTGFSPRETHSWNDYLTALTACSERNLIILDLAIQAKAQTLILTDGVGHAEFLSEMLSRRNIDHVLAHGQLNEKDRTAAFERIKTAKITIGTSGLLGEGLDIKGWTVLVMASPISSEIKLLQAIGRIVRLSEGKANGLIYDLRDDSAFSGSSFKKRFEIYKKNKIWVEFSGNKKAAIYAA